MNFQRLFSDFKIEFSIKVNKGWVNSKCVFCGGDSYKLGFNPVSDYCTCFACGYHDLNKTLSKLLNIPIKDISEITDRYKTRILITDNLNDKTKAISNVELPSNTFTSAERKYLKSRGFLPTKLNVKYGVVGGGITGKWKYRIIVPLIYKGKIMSFTGRTILSKRQAEKYKIPRYKNLSIDESVVDCKNLIFNLDNVKGRIGILCEGVFDVMRFDDNAVCSFGTALTEKQISILSEFFDKLYIIFDNETEAQKKAKKYGVKLSSLGVDVEIFNACQYFNKNDLGECSENEIHQIKKTLSLV